MLNILLGKSKSGKSKYIYDSIDEDILNKKHVILFVPSQCRALAEDRYMKYQKKEGIIDLKITTISEYVSEYLKDTNIYYDQNYITKLDKKIILTKIIIKNPEIFKVFNKVKEKSGFIEMLNIYMDIFKKEKINNNKIESLNFDDKLLEYKLKEINDVYTKYIEYTKDKYVDNVDQMSIFSKKIEKCTENDFNKTTVYFDEYNNFTQSEFLFISMLLKYFENVTVSLITDISCKEDASAGILEQSIFNIPNVTYLKLLKLANEDGIKVNTKYMYNNYSKAMQDIKYVADNIFLSTRINKKKAENVYAILTSNMYTEIENIAKDIVNKVKENAKYSDFVIYTSNLEEYFYIVSQIFYTYNIPFYTNLGIELNKNSLIEYILKLIDICIYDFKNENIFEILKLGLNDIDSKDISLLENYVLEFNINKYSWDKEFNLNNNKKDQNIYDLNKINEVKNTVINIFKNIKKLSTGKYTVKQIIEQIYLHLQSNKILEKYKCDIDNMSNSNNSEYIYMAEINKQVWKKICEIFDSIAKIYENEKVSIIEFRDMFKYAIKDIKLKTIPSTIDQVSIVDINSSKIDSKKYGYIIGVNENKLPKKVDEDPFFSDNEIEKVLLKSDIKIKETSISKYSMQLYNIYLAINNISDKLYIYIPSSDINGTSLRPSSIISNIKQILDIKIEGKVTTNNDIVKYEYKDIYNIYDLSNYMIKKLNDYLKNINVDDIDQLYVLNGIFKYLKSKENRKYLSLLNYVKNDQNLNKDTIKKLYSSDLTTSVSKLELFKKCPFSYYMNYGLKLKPRKIFSITSMDIGTFMHSVLEKFSTYLYKNSITWPSLLLNDENEIIWKNMLDQIIKTVLENSFLKHGQSIKYNILEQRLKNTMEKVVITIAKSFNQSEFEPYGYEIEFKNGGFFAPIQIKINDNNSMYLIGKIDRVDTLKFQDKIYARIVDYKSSSKDLKLDDIKEGLSLQLITYLYAFTQNIEQSRKIKTIPAAMLYFNLSDNLVNIAVNEKNEDTINKKITESLRMKGIFLKDIEILKKMDNNIDNQNKLIDISLRTINSNKNTKSLPENEYISLCEQVKNILKDIGKEILDGVVKIDPNKKKEVCKYCNYSSVCRKNNCI